VRPAIYPRVITWTLLDARRVTLIPPGHWLLIEDRSPFRATLESQQARVHVQSIIVGDVHIACFAPRENPAEAELTLERHAATAQKVSAAIQFLPVEPVSPAPTSPLPAPDALVLLTNGRGGMARLLVDLGRVNSKYDCVLGANLHPSVPVDRHVLVKRLRVWVNADGFLSALNFKNLTAFKAGPPARWQFIANAGDGRTVEIELRSEMLAGQNTVVFQFSRPTEKLARGKQLPAQAKVSLTVRVDIEDRNFHAETKHNDGADFHFSSHTKPLNNQAGFAFTPASDRQLRVWADSGEYHPQPEWCENIPHPVEQTRGQTGSGDAYSPGWFELPLAKGKHVTLVTTAETEEATVGIPAWAGAADTPQQARHPADTFEQQLVRAAQQFVVRRDHFKTVIAGYPWFLDWGRDSLICARGLLAAGMADEVRQILLTFARFEKDGTLPNTINGNDVSNRDTTDAPLWFAVGCEDLADKKFYQTVIDEQGRTIGDGLASIAENYVRGTPNGIHMDADSALIWSPSHFTWMDTNYPAGTPREGYPVEIQGLWIRLLRQLVKISKPADRQKWRDLADHATASFEKLFWLEDQGWFADGLLGGPRIIARDATCDTALRSNCLFAVSLGLATGERAQRCVAAAEKYLVVPGALRSLAPLPVSVPLAIYRDGQLLNDPSNPYCPRYEGDEDTQRKPAYHNGTAWTWTFPTFCEALATAWDFSPAAVAAAKSYLASAEKLLNQGCLGQLPEVLDGDAPHRQRGCDAQAWGATEALRVWKRLGRAGN
jgi:predicted glycogen debranching enzyme